MTDTTSGAAGTGSTVIKSDAGFYDRHSATQQLAAANSQVWWARAIEALGTDGARGPIVLADYGCATGRNSFETMDVAVKALRARFGDAPPILIFHNDRPGNDFNALFAGIDSGAAAAYRTTPGIFMFAAGCSFYDAVFPPGFVSLAWTSMSVHWLSRGVGRPATHIWNTPGLAASAAAAAQARTDWASFLHHRACELCPGGQLVVVCVSRRADVDDPGMSFLDVPNQLLQSMVDDGQLSDAEYQRMSVDVYCRDAEELREPFQHDGIGKRLALVDAVEQPLVSPAWVAYEQTGDVDALAADYTKVLQAITEPSLARGLDAARLDASRRAVLDDFYQRLERQVRMRPDTASLEWRLATLLIERRRDG